MGYKLLFGHQPKESKLKFRPSKYEPEPGYIFADAGNAFMSTTPWSDALDESLVGVGAEIKIATAIGW